MSLPIKKIIHLKHYSCSKSKCRMQYGLSPLIFLLYTTDLIMQEVPYDCHSSHLNPSEPRESKYADDVEF